MRPITRLALVLAAVPALAAAQFNPPPPPADVAPPEAVTPPGPPPSEPPPPPPETSPPEYPATPGAPPPQPAAAPAGEWVYTAEYGWLYMPLDRQFVYIPPDPHVFPEEYVYYPAYGWRWVVSPWVYGYGPQPRWGRAGPTVFVWYAHPWFRVGGYRGWGGYHGWGGYRGWIGPRVWGPRGWAGAPTYYRTGAGPRHPAPVMRPAPPRRAEHGHPQEHREHER